MFLKKSIHGGFTLIESLLYIGLFAIIIGGGMIATYQIIESTNQLSLKTAVEQEGEFILKKIDWALTSATAINVSGGNVLTITNTIVKPSGPIIFSESIASGDFLMDGVELNMSLVQISNLSFTKLTGSADGVTINFTVSSLNGKASQNFNVTKYAKF